MNTTEISKEQYLYEMYCLSCGHVPAYLQEDPGDGRIVSKGAILKDGSTPTPGSDIACLCPKGTGKAFATRAREEKLSKCCNARMVSGGVQCEACGSNGEFSVMVFVNAVAMPVETKLLSYRDIIALAFGKEDCLGSEVVLTITWHQRGSNNGGTVTPGESIEVVEGLIINATDTSNA